MEIEAPVDHESALIDELPIFIAKNGIKWRKHTPNRENVKTRKRNMEPNLPELKGKIQQQKKALSIGTIFSQIAFWGKSFITKINYLFTKISNKPSDLIKIKALLGLLYIAGVDKMTNIHLEPMESQRKFLG